MAAMPRATVLALSAYAALVASLATPLYEPLFSGRDDSWAVAVLLGGAHFGAAAAIRRAWALLLAVAGGLAGLVLGGAEGTAWLAVVLGIPVLAVVTALGLGAAKLAGDRAPAVAAAALGIAALPMPWAAVEHARRGAPLPAAVQERLPIDTSLGNLCPGASTPAGIRRDLRARAATLARQLERDPQRLVTYTYHWAHEPEDERRRITVRELAEEQLDDLRSGGGDCAPDVARRLRAAME